MWIYLNNAGQVITQLNHGNFARQGGTGFELFVCFNNKDVSPYVATVTLKDPNGDSVAVTPVMDNAPRELFNKLPSEANTGAFINGDAYRGKKWISSSSLYFALSGNYEMSVSLYDGDNNKIVEGLITIPVEASAVVDTYNISETQFSVLMEAIMAVKNIAELALIDLDFINGINEISEDNIWYHVTADDGEFYAVKSTDNVVAIDCNNRAINFYNKIDDSWVLAPSLNLINSIYILENSSYPSSFFDYFHIGQMFYKKDKTFLIKTENGIINVSDLDIGTINLENNGDAIDLDKCLRTMCVIEYENEIYLKTKEEEFSYHFSKVDDLYVSSGGNVTISKEFIEVDKLTGVATYYEQEMSTFYTTDKIDSDFYNKDEVYNKTESDERYAQLGGNNTFRGTNIFNDVVPETGSGVTYTPSNLNQLANTGKLKEVSDDLATEVTNRQEADALLIPKSWKGNADGVASLDNNGKIPLNQLPDSILGQVKWVGNIYIVSSTSADSYNMRECGVVQLTDYALYTLGLTGQTEITINGLTVTGTNLVTYLDLFNAIIEKYDDARLVSMFFIVSSRINHNGPVWTGYNVLTDVALNGFISPSEQEYFTNVSTGDWIMILSISNLGSITYAKVDNSDAVISVNGQTGPVTLYGTDIKLSSEDNTKVTEKFGSIETDIAPYWNSANTYVVGDLVIYKGKLYKCIVNIPTPENNFVPFHWQETSVKTLLKTLPQYVDITILTTDWNNNSISKTTHVTDLGEYDIVLCLPNGYENDAYVRAFGVELSSFVNETGVATFNCMETPTETIHITLQILRR